MGFGIPVAVTVADAAPLRRVVASGKMRKSWREWSKERSTAVKLADFFPRPSSHFYSNFTRPNGVEGD